MQIDDTDEVLLAIAAARFAVEFEASHPTVAERAERVSSELLNAHGLTNSEATASIFECC